MARVTIKEQRVAWFKETAAAPRVDLHLATQHRRTNLTVVCRKSVYGTASPFNVIR